MIAGVEGKKESRLDTDAVKAERKKHETVLVRTSRRKDRFEICRRKRVLKQRSEHSHGAKSATSLKNSKSLSADSVRYRKVRTVHRRGPFRRQENDNRFSRNGDDRCFQPPRILLRSKRERTRYRLPAN